MRLKNVLIVVKDIERSRQFYHDLFGFEVLVDFDGNITAAEARRILRIATKLEYFEKIPGESETPEA